MPAELLPIVPAPNNALGVLSRQWWRTPCGRSDHERRLLNNGGALMWNGSRHGYTPLERRNCPDHVTCVRGAYSMGAPNTYCMIGELQSSNVRVAAWRSRMNLMYTLSETKSLLGRYPAYEDEYHECELDRWSRRRLKERRPPVRGMLLGGRWTSPVKERPRR